MFAASETALASWLDSGHRCLFLSAEDYYYDRGMTPFLDSYLGVSSVTNDVGYTTVTGSGEFAAFGPYSLVYPVSNYSDTLVADGDAELAFLTGASGAATLKEFASKTLFFGFPWEAIPTAPDRQAVLQHIWDWCDPCDGPDSDGDGVPDECDQCEGNDASGDGDNDLVCADLDCDDGDPTVQYPDNCGVCGGDDSSCSVFADDFESGHTGAWSMSSG